MNKQDLEQRINQIKSSQDALKGQLSTLQGHLDEATFWLNSLSLPVVETVNEVQPEPEIVHDVEIEVDCNAVEEVSE